MLIRICTGHFNYRLGEHHIKIENSYTGETKEIKIPGNPKVADVFNDTLVVTTDVERVKYNIEIQPRSAYSVVVITSREDCISKISKKVTEIIKFSRSKTNKNTQVLITFSA